MAKLNDLPPEVLSYIIKQFDRSDFRLEFIAKLDSTIFSAMRVNKYWSKVAMEFLLQDMIKDDEEWSSFVRRAKEREDYYWEMMADNGWVPSECYEEEA